MDNEVDVEGDFGGRPWPDNRALTIGDVRTSQLGASFQAHASGVYPLVWLCSLLDEEGSIRGFAPGHEHPDTLDQLILEPGFSTPDEGQLINTSCLPVELRKGMTGMFRLFRIRV